MLAGARVARRSSVFRQLQEDVHIQSGLMTGVTTIETPTSRHSHIANQHRAHTQIAHTATQTLDKHHQIRMPEIATLIGTHDLIMFGLYRQRVSTNDTAI